MSSVYDRTAVIGFDEEIDGAYSVLRGLAVPPESPLAPVVLFDARHLAYRAYHTRDLSAPDGAPTSALHGVVSMVLGAVSAVGSRRFLLVWDGSIDYKRRLYPAYKARKDAPRTEEEVLESRNASDAVALAEAAISEIGFPSVRVPDLEADDSISLLCCCSRSRPKIIVSDDKDYYQLLGPLVRVYRGVLREVIDEALFVSRHGFPASAYPDYKALVGETKSGDNIPGVRGVGDTYGCKFIGTHGSIEAVISACEAAVRESRARKIEAAVYAQRDSARLSYRLSRMARSFSELPGLGVDRDRASSLLRSAYQSAVAVRRSVSRSAYLRWVGRYGFSSATLTPEALAAVGIEVVP